jgi:hypothetical protein
VGTPGTAAPAPGSGHRLPVYGPAEQRAAHLVAVLRAGRFAFPIIDAVIATMRDSGSVRRALAELSRRDEQVHRASRERLRATGALDAHLDTYYPADSGLPARKRPASAA